ncbi:hypothetical protein [Campylobacter fetus]|uniref:hypothetical protein n=1 Tax=Campylobacter fetus TaxID=196 RepID=UPI0005092281|nr:hypothetical protein [Campylobacter fetus]AIR78593.1 hypothetical protein CFF04554_0676 [Campylobacter fetus subsp. fetus 04/554]
MNNTHKKIVKFVLEEIKKKGYCSRKDVLNGCGLDNSNLSKALKNIYLITKE